MITFAALLQTQVGQVVLASFSKAAGMSEGAMRSELFANVKLADYFCQVCRTAVDALKADAEAA